MSDTFTDETYNTLCRDAENYLAGGSPEQARELLLKAISLIGTRPRARSILSDTCMSMELWSEARSQLEILITLEDGNVGNNFRLAQVLEELGEYQLAFDNYSVVCDNEPDHHGAAVALKRIAARTKESGVNLADIFVTSSGKTETSPDSETDEKQDNQQLREGIQVFPDVPTDSLFADSEDEQENSIEKLLKNIGLSTDESEEDDSDDISKLLENIGVSTSEIVQSVFSESGIEETDTSDSLKTDRTEDSESDEQGDTESTDKENSVAKKKPSGPTLDDIFGITSTPSESEEEDEKPGEEVTETVEEEAQEQEEENESLQAIFNDAETKITHTEIVDEETAEKSESDSTQIEVLIGKSQEEETPSEAEEPEEQIQEEEQVEEQVQEEEKVEEHAQEEETSLSFDPWSIDSGLLTVHLTSGSVDIDQCLLTVFEDTLSVDINKKGTCNISGCGTFLLNCGPEEPLILELSENMTVRPSALILTTGSISSEPLDGQLDNSLAVLKNQVHMKGVFRTPSPVRVILLGGNKRIFNVRTASIIASDPGIVLSNEKSPDHYTAITGFGKLYLIE